MKILKIDYGNGYNGFLGGSESACNAGDARDVGSIPVFILKPFNYAF